MYTIWTLLPNLFLSTFVNIGFLLLVAKTLTRDWSFHLREIRYIILSCLLTAFVRIFVLQVHLPNLSAHVFNDQMFLALILLYAPVVFLYFHQINSYPVKKTAILMSLMMSIVLVSDFLTDLASVFFFPDMRLYASITLHQYPMQVMLHWFLHLVVAFALTGWLVDITAKLRTKVNQSQKLQTIFLFVCMAFLLLISLGLLIFYAEEYVFLQRALPWPAIFMFSLMYLLLIGSFLRTKSLSQKYNLLRRETEYKALRHYMQRLEQQHTAMRKFKHDYQNILTSMDNFFLTNDWVGLKQYYIKAIKPASEIITKNHFALEALSNIKVPEIKSLLAAKLFAAQNMALEIDTIFEAYEEIHTIPVDSVSLVRMLGIILDNAIEELAVLSQGKLAVACFESGENLTFVVQNTCRPNIPKLHQLKQSGFSTKGKTRGFGLNILDEIQASHSNVTLSTAIEATTFTQKITISAEGETQNR